MQSKYPGCSWSQLRSPKWAAAEQALVEKPSENHTVCLFHCCQLLAWSFWKYQGWNWNKKWVCPKDRRIKNREHNQFRPWAAEHAPHPLYPEHTIPEEESWCFTVVWVCSAFHCYLLCHCFLIFMRLCITFPRKLYFIYQMVNDIAFPFLPEGSKRFCLSNCSRTLDTEPGCLGSGTCSAATLGWYWPSYLIFLCLSFLLCKMGR